MKYLYILYEVWTFVEDFPSYLMIILRDFLEITVP